ncbi:DUF1868 domain-containing protein [Paenibacillus sonchi]|uniref:DUF1868 domain-containing protein n=1 Tax=Paenibacillus sonchi TaxID=373687 RepID=A0A974PCB9_9BACL|nr:DUF1868 domain-containing protein [Paenibacillus sonchi]QQZ61289.1 DUF1868 domain-containing protein [Paenibacillus sonchi]
MLNQNTTSNVGRKFNQDGSVKEFPGNTIISCVDPSSETFAALNKLREQFLLLKSAGKFTVLPPSSFHMTLIQGICDVDRKAELWSRYLSLDTPLEEVDTFFKEKYKYVRQLEPVKMNFDFLDLNHHVIKVSLRPQDLKDALELTRFREDVSYHLGLRFPDHDRYVFHISLAYQIYHLTDEEKLELQVFKEKMDVEFGRLFGSFEPPVPRLVLFNNMFKFGEVRD